MALLVAGGRVEWGAVASSARAWSPDGVVRYDRVGVLATPWGELSLWWIAAYGGGLFVPFRDATSGHETYGGGRYLTDT